MEGFRLSTRATTDLRNIYVYSAEKFGEDQADKYISELLKCLNTLSINVRLGRLIPNVRVDVRQFYYRSHTIYYKAPEKQILIIRIQGNRMEAKRHL